MACARDGWGSEEIGDTSGTLHIQAWLLDSCKKKFSRTFVMDKDNINTMFPTVDNVQFDSPYSLTSTIVSVQVHFNLMKEICTNFKRNINLHGLEVKF